MRAPKFFHPLIDMIPYMHHTGQVRHPRLAHLFIINTQVLALRTSSAAATGGLVKPKAVYAIKLLQYSNVPMQANHITGSFENEKKKIAETSKFKIHTWPWAT